MMTFRRVNFIIAIVGLVLFSLSLMNIIHLSMEVMSLITFIMFFFFGIEHIKDKDQSRNMGYAYVAASVLMLTFIIVDFFRTFN